MSSSGSAPAPSPRQLYARLLGYVKPYWRMFVVAILGMVGTAATEPLLPALLKGLFDSGFGSQGNQDVWYYPLLLIGIFLIRGVVGFIADYAMGWVGQKVIMDMRNAMFASLVRLPTPFFDNQNSATLMSKIAYDVFGVASAATNALTVLVRDSVTVIGLLGYLLYLNWKLTLIAFAVAPLMSLVVKLFGKRMRQATREAQRSMGTITHVLEEAISAHKVVKVFGGTAHEMARFDAACNEQRGLSMRQKVAEAGQGPFVQLITAVALATIIAVALAQSADDHTTVGGFVGFITAMLMLVAPTKRLTDVNAAIQRGLAAAESVFELIDEPAEPDDGQTELARARGAIDFDHVTFRYPGATRDALSDITVHIEPGEQVALVGASGGGKTTVASLIPRFYNVTAGSLRIDGHDIRDLRIDSLRANIALVSQDVVLFNDTVAANIAYGSRAGASREEIRAAARAAHALDFIEAMPEGFDTSIGENGVKLSGGQRQRLAIARAILKDAPILILDEATSALDTESERAVQAALDELMQGRTTLIIAHRLSTIEKADRILVMEAGRVVESGRHDELLSRDGSYARLYRLVEKNQGILA